MQVVVFSLQVLAGCDGSVVVGCAGMSNICTFVYIYIFSVCK